MSNMYGKDKFHDRQKAVLQKSAQKIENDSGWSQDNFLRGYAEEILPASGAELSFGELCAIGEQVEQEAAFSAKEAMRNKIKARRDAERYKSTGTDSEQRTPNPFEDSNAAAIESPKNEDTLNTTRKHADAQSTKSAGLKTSKRRSIVEMVQKLKKYVPILVTSSSFDKAFNDTYKGFIKPQSEYPDAYTDTFYISQKLSNSTGNSILDVLNDAFSDGSSEWVGYKGGFFSYNDDACVLVTAKGMSFSESGDYSLTYVESGKTTTLTDSRGFEQEADIYYAYNTDEFSEAYENLNTVDNEIADESSLIFEFLIGNENYTDWQ